MWRKIIGLLIMLVVLPGFSFASTQSKILVADGRALLFQNGNPTYQGILDANEKFKAAVEEDTSDQEAHLFYAVTRLASFVLKTSDGNSFSTLADIIQAMGIPIYLDNQLKDNPPFGDFPELAYNLNLPETTPDGDELRSVLSLGLVDVIDQALANLDKIDDTINVVLTGQEIDDLTDVEVDYTDVLLARALLNTFKTIVLIISAYDLDGADIRELMAFANSGMMDLHPNMITELFTKYPNFLHLAENGATLLSNAKTAFQSAYNNLSDAHASLNEESKTENQNDNLFSYESEGDEQEFEMLLSGFSELIDSLAENRPATIQNVDSYWNVVPESGDTLNNLRLREIRFENGSVARNDSDFWGVVGGNHIYGWISYWKITENGTDRNIKIILDYWGYKRIELTGVLANNDTIITGACSFQENQGSGYTETNSVAFTADRVQQFIDDVERLDLNALFGNTGKSKLDIRNFLPKFDMFGEPRAGTFPEPVFNGLFPDYATNSIIEEVLELDQPYQVFTIPEASVNILLHPDNWPGSTHVTQDTYDDDYLEDGLDINDIYIAKDNEFLYMGMSLTGDPLTGNQENDYIAYQMEFRRERDDWYRNALIFGAEYAGYENKWHLNIGMKDPNGNYFNIATYKDTYVHAGTNFIAWKLPLSAIDPLETFGGAYLTANTWSEVSHQGDWMDRTTRLEPVYTIQGSVSIPDGYTGGKIYLYLTDSEYPPQGDDAIIGTYIESDGSFALTGAPYSSENLYLYLLWDKDGNGIPNTGDYIGMTNFKIQGDVNTGNIELTEKPPLHIEAVSVKSVHSGDNQFRTFFDIEIGQDFQDALPGGIDTITITCPDGTDHQVYPDGGAQWLPEWNEFFMEMPGNPQLDEYVFTVTARDGSVGIKSDIQKDLITIPIVDVNYVKIDTSSKTPVISWDPVKAPGTGIAYRLEVNDMDGQFSFRTGRDWNMASCALPELQAGKQYQYRIRAIDDSDWIQVDNRSHTSWTPFTMDNLLGHSSVPAIELDGWGAVEWFHVGSEPGVSLEVKVTDHDGVSYDGSSHSVYAIPIDESGNLIGDDSARFYLNFNYSENGIQGSYSGWIDAENLIAGAVGVRFFVVDPDDVGAEIDDTKTGPDMVPPDDIKLVCTVNGTTPTFTWNPVSGAKYYQIRIYDENRTTTIAKLSTPNVTTYTVPPGFLNPGTTYQYRLEARDGNWGFETDQNIVFPPKDASGNYPVFTTGALTNKPFITADYSGVSTWSNNYTGIIPSFWMKIYDAQGTPGNIQSVKAVHPDGITETQLYYEYNESGNCAIYSNDSYETPQEGTYTFEVTDKEGNQFSLTEELAVNPMGYPDESSLSVSVNGTGAEFDWADVTALDGTDPAFYRLEIFNKNHEQIFKFETTQSQYSLAPGFLEKGEVYGFRVKAVDEFWNQNADNGSSSPWSPYRAINFKTEPIMENGTNQPAIDTGNFGVAVNYLEHPVTGDPSYWLQFSVKVTDLDGVPENIKSVTVTGPGIAGSLTLNYDSPREGNTAEYWKDIIYDSYDDIQEGVYTFTVEDENGNTATTTDTLVKKIIPLVPYLTPADGVDISSDRPVIDWADPAGGPYFYKVRIYQYWNTLIHQSGILETSSYILPGNILQSGELYGYRIYAYDKDINTDDVDNISINQIFFAKQNHFTVSDGEPPSIFTQLFKLINIMIGNTADISSFEVDINQDNKLDMKDVLPILQEAGDLR